MKAFIGHSFDEKDNKLVNKVARFLESAGLECVTGEKAQNMSVAAKVKDRILHSDIFVGIFTCDKKIISNRDTASKPHWYSRKTDYEKVGYITSNWIIQESGFAIGKEKEMIFLVENGVYKFPEIQGDMEVVYFDRDSIDQQWVKLNEMIEYIKKSKDIGVAASTQEIIENSEETKEKPEEEDKREERTEEVDKLLDKVFEELEQKNYTEAQRIFDKEAEAKIDANDRSFYRAVVLRLSDRLGDKDAFDKLVKLSEIERIDPRVIKQLAYRYKEMGEYEKAKDKFIIAKEKYDINDEEQKKRAIDCYVQAGWCLAHDNKHGDAIRILRKILLDNNFKDHMGRILHTMAEISKNKNDIEEFFIYAEAALEADSNNKDLRFGLAYKYNEKDNNNLAFLHYKKLTRTQINYPHGQNNLGVTYGQLGFSGKSVERFFRAAEYKETLAMSNIANKYLNEGFTEDAQKMIDKAHSLASEEVKLDYRVGESQKRLNDLLKEENEKEKDILQKAEEERKYRVKHAMAFCSDKCVKKSEIEGTWETPWGNGQLTFNEESNSFEIDISFKEADPFASLASALSGGQGKQEEVYKNVHHNIKGHVNNLSGQYTVDTKETGTTLLTKGVEYAATGYMVIDEGSNSIDVMEKTKDGKNEFKQWKKLKN